MTIIIRKNAGKGEIEHALEKIKKQPKAKLSDYYGKMKGAFGDGLSYQKKVRNEWD